MKQLAVISGKGGTGKTSLTASFVELAYANDRNLVIADCDVDAADLHLLLHPQKLQTQEFRGPKLAVIDGTKCTQCGVCHDVCRFDAVNKKFQIDAIACEGCGVCNLTCPADAISLQERISGYAFVSTTKYGFMSHARLNPGQANSGKLVTVVRHNARNLAEKEQCELILIDGPPGIGCPVIASINDVDAGLIVTEPSMSGMHDLTRVLRLLDHFRIRPFVCINMYDINQENTGNITALCAKHDVEVLGQIPFDPHVTRALVAAQPVVAASPTSIASRELRTMWNRVIQTVMEE